MPCDFISFHVLFTTSAGNRHTSVLTLSSCLSAKGLHGRGCGYTHTHTFTCLVFGRRLANNCFAQQSRNCFRKQIPHKCSIYNKPEVKLNQAYFLAYCLVCSLLLLAAPHSSPPPLRGACLSAFPYLLNIFYCDTFVRVSLSPEGRLHKDLPWHIFVFGCDLCHLHLIAVPLVYAFIYALCPYSNMAFISVFYCASSFMW